MALIPNSNLTAEEKRAERDARQQEALLREVDDAVREDQFAHAFMHYGKPVGALIVAALRAFGAWLAWSSHRDAQL